MKRGSQIYSAIVGAGLLGQACALEIVFRYDLDTGGFFDQPGAKEALEVAGQFYEDLIVDELEAIDPDNFSSSTNFRWRPTYLEPNQRGAERTIFDQTDFVIPENTIVIFAGGRNLTTSGQGGPGGIQFLTPANTAWFNQLLNRGEPGATTFQNNSFSSNPTDLAPWGGTVFFDNDQTWNFSTTDAAAAPGIDFLSVALHEIGHVLGLGYVSQTSSWLTLVSGSTFKGPLATTSNGSVEPRLNGLAHWSSTLSQSRTIAVFGRAHGELQKPMMDLNTGTTTSSVFIVPTDLDLAALRDIGWELSVSPGGFNVELDFDPAAPSLGIPTVTGTNYQVSRADSPETLAPSGPTIVGDGTVQTWNDPVTAAARAFYSVDSFQSPSTRSKSSQKNSQPATLVPAELNEEGLPFLPPVQCECDLH